MSEQTTSSAPGADPSAAAAVFSSARPQQEPPSTAPADPDAPPAPRWWERDSVAPELRRHLEAKGWTMDDPAEAALRAAEAQRHAETRLGKPAEALIDKPKEGQALAEWRRANAQVFGLPESPDGYELARPDLPEGMPWDADFEAEARKLAHERGLAAEDLQSLVDLYAKRAGGMFGDVEQQLQAAQADMRAELQRDWGDQLDARLTRAAQAAQAVAASAGLTPEAIEIMGSVLSKQVGDAATLRIFDKIADMMAEDGAAGLGAGASQFGQTPADARAQLSAMYAPEGEMAKAYASNDQRKIAEATEKAQRLARLAAQ